MTRGQLIKEIIQANMAYASGIPFMTDSEYDLLWQQLYAIDPHNNLLYHTAQNRAALTGKTWHKHPIFGTNKAFNMIDLKPFLTRFGSYVLKIEPKYDGCAAVVTLTDSGIALTLEGDGRCGADISHMIPYIKFPFQLRHFQAVEILIPLNEWNPDYGANPRNVVAGWLARKYDKPSAMMTAIPHNYGELFTDYTYSGSLEAMGEFLLETYSNWSKIYPMDGLMIKVADEKVRLVAGNNGQTNNWSIAWKPPIQVKETKVVDIEWNISRLGRAIPTVVYEPIELCGTTNNRVTGNNAQWIKDKQIVIDSIITIGKAGEIIPKIIDVDNDEWLNKLKIKLRNDGINIPEDKPFVYGHLPEHCPKCHEPLQWEGVHLVCNGPTCIAKLIVSIAYFYSQKGIKIDGVGEGIIEKLLQNEKCYSVLSTKPWALLDPLSYDIVPDIINEIGVTIYSNIAEQVFSMNNQCHMAHFVSGLGLPGLAYKSALRLCQYLKTGEINIHITERAKQSFVTAASIYTNAITEMKNFSFAPLPTEAKAIYCITGSLSQSREAMIEILNGYGYEFSAGVTRETNYLVVGDDPGRNKIEKAIRYNIPQITEEQLFALLEKELFARDNNN